VIRRANSHRSEEETSFRHGKRGREAMVPAGQGDKIHFQPSKQAGLGCITSRPNPTVTFWEVLAYEMGVNVTQAKQMWEQGLIK